MKQSNTNSNTLTKHEMTQLKRMQAFLHHVGFKCDIKLLIKFYNNTHLKSSQKLNTYNASFICFHCCVSEDKKTIIKTKSSNTKANRHYCMHSCHGKTNRFLRSRVAALCDAYKEDAVFSQHEHPLIHICGLSFDPEDKECGTLNKWLDSLEDMFGAGNTEKSLSVDIKSEYENDSVSQSDDSGSDSDSDHSDDDDDDDDEDIDMDKQEKDDDDDQEEEEDDDSKQHIVEQRRNKKRKRTNGTYNLRQRPKQRNNNNHNRNNRNRNQQSRINHHHQREPNFMTFADAKQMLEKMKDQETERSVKLKHDIDREYQHHVNELQSQKTWIELQITRDCQKNVNRIDNQIALIDKYEMEMRIKQNHFNTTQRLTNEMQSNIQQTQLKFKIDPFTLSIDETFKTFQDIPSDPNYNKPKSLLVSNHHQDGHSNKTITENNNDDNDDDDDDVTISTLRDVENLPLKRRSKKRRRRSPRLSTLTNLSVASSSTTTSTSTLTANNNHDKENSKNKKQDEDEDGDLEILNGKIDHDQSPSSATTTNSKKNEKEKEKETTTNSNGFSLSLPNLNEKFDAEKKGITAKRKNKKSQQKQKRNCNTSPRPTTRSKTKAKRKRRHTDINNGILIPSTDRVHPCDECDTGFSTRKKLQEHKATHMSEKPHQCKVCHQRFKALDILNSHKIKKHLKLT